MKLFKSTKEKNVKKLCIYISQETEDGGGVMTTIDHVGDEEMLQEYKRDIVKEALLEYTFNK